MVTVLDRVQQSQLPGLEELKGLIRASLGAVEAGKGGKDELAAVADFLVDEGIGLRQRAQRLWDLHWTMALAGQIPDRQAHGARLRARLAEHGPPLAEAAEIARAFADLSGREVARLAEFEKQAAAFARWVEECLARWEMLDRPRPPLDRERVAQAREAFARGECEDLADVIARVERGGPLVAE